jgi:hypothetical protein
MRVQTWRNNTQHNDIQNNDTQHNNDNIDTWDNVPERLVTLF